MTAAGADVVAEFTTYRSRNDMPNAIAIYAGMADWQFGQVCESPAWDRSKPSIVSSFMPKSGGTFMFNRMIRAYGYLEYPWGITRERDATGVYAVPRAIRHYLSGGLTCHTHFRPAPHNLQVLDSAGVRQVWVHLRDPRQTIVSTYFHFAGIGHGTGATGIERAMQARQQAALLGLDVELGHREKLNAFVRREIGWMADWVRQWLACATERPGYVVFTTFDELAGAEAMFTRVFEAFGAPIAPAAIPAILPEDRRRSERAADWRDGLTSETIGIVDAAVRAAIGAYPLAASLCRDL